MFLGHIAVGLAGARETPRVSLGTWVAAVLLVDLIWPLLLLAGIEHVRIAPGITAFTPLDFTHYPFTHSLVAGAVWGAVFGGTWWWRRGARPALLLALGVLSHWVLDAISHRPDMPILPGGPFVGLGLWHSVPLTLVVELAVFGGAMALYAAARPQAARRPRFFVFVAILLVTYIGAAFGPPPPDVRTLAFSALALWLLVPFAWWVDR